ncbi:hypothetical protein T05_1592 [Trichinella murrelli]|uniref:Uncharacterized protein n=1 Tax=Trichinella murrelli TaxID=144512 RepID=A0A0V0U3Q6_9BILA|nr:hypothetical protein T05_1592 [Trichinella murrelli]
MHLTLKWSILLNLLFEPFNHKLYSLTSSTKECEAEMKLIRIVCVRNDGYIFRNVRLCRRYWYVAHAIEQLLYIFQRDNTFGGFDFHQLYHHANRFGHFGAHGVDRYSKIAYFPAKIMQLDEQHPQIDACKIDAHGQQGQSDHVVNQDEDDIGVTVQADTAQADGCYRVEGEEDAVDQGPVLFEQVENDAAEKAIANDQAEIGDQDKAEYLQNASTERWLRFHRSIQIPIVRTRGTRYKLGMGFTFPPPLERSSRLDVLKNAPTVIVEPADHFGQKCTEICNGQQ